MMKYEKWLRLVLYILSYGLLMEWTKALIQMTGAETVLPYALFLGLSLSLAYLRVPTHYATILRFISFAIAFYVIAAEGVSLTTFGTTIGTLFKEVWRTGQVAPIVEEIREPFVLLLLWGLTYFIHYWIDHLHRIFLFVFATFSFFFALEWIDADYFTFSVGRIGTYSVLLIVCMRLYRWIVERTVRSNDVKRAVVVQLPLLFVLLLGAAILPSWLEEEEVTESLESGYRENDEQLGGPFRPNDEPVLQYVSTKPRYFKMETKDYYTSEGWKETIRKPSSIEWQEGEGERVFVDLQMELPFLPVTYGMTQVELPADETLRGNGDEQFTVGEGAVQPPFSYRLIVEDERIRADRLRRAPKADVTSDSLQPYVQLPDNLPNRVKELAQSITEQTTSDYDAAKAIERYFHEASFTYDHTNVQSPKEGEDYVDYFLFETKRGYCDNFSTAMVVLLRANDIPARWVKGYAPGKVIKEEGLKKTYHVTENEAHSWVEMYIEGFGWLPFEPTLGFDQSSTYESSDEVGETNDPNDSSIEEIPPPSASDGWEEERGQRTSPVWIGVLSFAVFIGLLMLYVVWRRRASAAPDERARNRFAQLLVKVHETYRVQRAPHETLRQFARTVDEKRGDQKMSELIATYEQLLYDDRDTNDWESFERQVNELLEDVSG